MELLHRYLPIVARVLLGLIYFVFGLNGFLHFMPLPELPPDAGALLQAFGKSGYMFPLVKSTEVIGGALLLSGRFVPLALILLAPVTVHIFAFHAVLAPGGLGMGILLVVAHVYLGVAHRRAFAPLLTASA